MSLQKGTKAAAKRAGAAKNHLRPSPSAFTNSNTAVTEIRATTIFNAKGKDWLKSTIAAKKSTKIAPDKMRCFIATSLYRYFFSAKKAELFEADQMDS